MPNIKSAKKRVKVINTKTMRNKAVKSDLKTALKKADAAVAENAENKEEVVRAAIKKVDMASLRRSGFEGGALDVYNSRFRRTRAPSPSKQNALNHFFSDRKTPSPDGTMPVISRSAQRLKAQKYHMQKTRPASRRCQRPV